MSFTPFFQVVQEMQALVRSAPGLLVPDEVEEKIEAVFGKIDPLSGKAYRLCLRYLGMPVRLETEIDYRLHDRAVARLERHYALTHLAEAVVRMQHTVRVRVRPEALRTIATTTLRSMPGACPRLLRHPVVIEGPEPDLPLWGTCANLCVVPHPEGFVRMAGAHVPVGICTTVLNPAWGKEGDLPGPDDFAPLTMTEDPRWGRFTPADLRGYQAWNSEAWVFLIKLGMLLEAENSPLAVRDQGGTLPSGARPPPGERWTVRYVGISEAHKAALERARALASQKAAAASAAGAAAGHAAARRQALVEVETLVAGHLKRQPCGPGRSQHKTVYIEPYEATRHVAPNVEIRVL